MAAFKTPITRADVKSSTWDHMREHVGLRIAELQVDLESTTNTELTSAAIRGRLMELRKILALERAPGEAPRAGDRFGRDPVDTVTPPLNGGM